MAVIILKDIGKVLGVSVGIRLLNQLDLSKNAPLNLSAKIGLNLE